MNNVIVPSDIRAIVDGTPYIAWQANPDGTIAHFNQAFYNYTGATQEQAPSYILDAFHPGDVRSHSQAWVKAIEGGLPCEADLRLLQVSGVYAWFSVRHAPIRSSDGTIRYWIGSCVEIDNRKRAEQINNFLAAALSTVTDYDDIHAACARLTEAATATVAVFCFIDLLNEHGQLERIAWAHRDQARQIAMSTCTNCPPFCGFALESRFAAALHTKQATFLRSVDAQRLREEANQDLPDAGVTDWLEVSSLVSIPLTAQDRVLGVLTLARAHKGDLFEESDVKALEGVGRCIGLALSSAATAIHNQHVADSFQHAALPQTLPQVPGFTFSAVYQAAKTEATVGGDWYDAFRIPDGRIVLSIGDVMGSGLEAAVTMSAVRQCIRGAAHIYPDANAILNAADRALRSEQPNRIVTAFVAILDPLTLTITYAGAGHPSPLMRTKSGKFIELVTNDLPLGLREQEAQVDGRHNITISEPSFIVFYTDGLTEITHNLFEGELRLRNALESGRLFEVAEPAAVIRDEVFGHVQDMTVSDDIALFVLRIDSVTQQLTQSGEDETSRARWTFQAHDAEVARTVRKAITQTLAHYGANEDEICSVELLFSELIGNVMRHADGNAEVAIDFSTDYPVLHVIDHGPGFTLHATLPNDVMSESGRGLFITQMVSREFSVLPCNGGGSHARVVLDVPPKKLAANAASFQRRSLETSESGSG